MKRIYILTAWILITLIVNGQSQLPSPTRKADDLAGHSRSSVYKQIAYRRDVWDNPSSQWKLSDSSTYAHNPQGQEILDLYLHYDGSNWGNSSRTTNTFDASGNKTNILYDKWKPASSTWVHTSQIGYEFDGNRNNTKYLYQNWDTVANSWVNNTQYLYGYNSQNMMDNYYYQNWDTTTNNWINHNKTIYTYNAGLKAETELQQQWKSGAWRNSYKYTYTYNASNTKTLAVLQQWDTVSLIWVNLLQSAYTLDANNHPIHIVSNFWRDATNSYDSLYLDDVFTYNASGYELTFIRQQWNTSNSMMENTQKWEYLYDSQNRETSFDNFGWSASTNSWVSYGKNNYHYDNLGNNIYTLYQTFNSTNSTYENSSQNFNYFDLLEGITEVRNDLNATLYPNPSVSNGSTLQFTANEDGTLTIHIYDCQGRLCSMQQQDAITGTNKINVANNLPAGLYTVQVRMPGNGKTSVMKLVKQ